MVGACGTRGIKEKCLQSFGGETWWRGTSWKNYLRVVDNIEMDYVEIFTEFFLNRSFGWGYGLLEGFC